MHLALYMTEGLFVVGTIVFFALYCFVMKDRAFLWLGIFCGAVAGISFFLESWYPLIIGGALLNIVLILGTGAWFNQRGS